MLYILTKYNPSIPDAEEKFKDQMQTTHDEELAPLLHMFHDWQSNHPGNELLILSGDVHVGGFTDILIKVLNCTCLTKTTYASFQVRVHSIIAKLFI